MFILLTSILRKKPIQIVKKQIDWQKMFRYAEYHNVLTLFYYSVLGLEKEFGGNLGETLYQRYKKELLQQSSYRTAEEAISWKLEQYHVHAVLLSGTAEYGLYDPAEMGGITHLEFLVETDSLGKIHELMTEMDYERKEEQGYRGIFYIRAPGVRVRFLDEIPEAGPRIRKVLEHQARGKPYVRQLPLEKQYIYFLAAFLENYFLGKITIRHILDFYLFREKFGSTALGERTEELLKKTGLNELERDLTGLGELWFSNGVPGEESSTVLALEEYILDPGKSDPALDKRLLLSSGRRLDFYGRDREEEWRERRKGWMFPSVDYMKQFFPILDKAPFLIFFCWGIRSFRIWEKIAEQNIGELKKTILEKYKRKKSVEGAKGENED